MPTKKQIEDFADIAWDNLQIVKGDLFNEAVKWVKENLSPDDVFDDDQLGRWAEANGYKKEGE